MILRISASAGATLEIVSAANGLRTLEANPLLNILAGRLRNYEPVGFFEAFQTLNRLSSSEEMHYEFDSSGRLRQTAFAQSPQTGSGAPTSAPYYTASYPAACRAVSFYDYDGGGRPIDLQQGWQTWNGSATNATCGQARKMDEH